jgi:hypothetical protein
MWTRKDFVKISLIGHVATGAALRTIQSAAGSPCGAEPQWSVLRSSFMNDELLVEDQQRSIASLAWDVLIRRSQPHGRIACGHSTPNGQTAVRSSQSLVGAPTVSVGVIGVSSVLCALQHADAAQARAQKQGDELGTSERGRAQGQRLLARSRRSGNVLEHAGSGSPQGGHRLVKSVPVYFLESCVL